MGEVSYSVQRVSGNRIGLVLAGTGEIAPKHARAIRATDGLDLVAVVSRDRLRAESLAARFGAVPLTDVAEALARDDADAMAICTEHDRHVPLLLAAAEAGCHALVEKPLAIDLAAGAAALDACEAAGVTVGAVLQRRFDPALSTLRRAVDGGRTGALIAVELSMVWRRDAKYFDSLWRGDAARAGGGVAMMQAIHLIDAARWLAGDIVEVDGAVHRARRHADVEDVAAAVFRFESGALGSFFATTAGAGALANRAAFHFEHGSAVVEAEHLRVWSLPTDAPSPRPRWRASLGRYVGRSLGRRIPWRLVPRDAGPKGSFADVYADFRDAIRTGCSPRCSGRDSLKSVAVVDALYRAARSGTRVRVDRLARE